MTTKELTDHDEIRAVIDGVCGAIGAKNAAEAVSYYATDARQFTLAPPLQHTKPDAGALEQWFATWRGAIGCDVSKLEITAGRDIGFCTSLNRMTGTKTDGETVDLWFRATLGLRKIDGRWKIVHEHESVPFYMDGSFKAAIDLRP